MNIRALHQAVLNLLGRSDDPLELIGSGLSEADSRLFQHESGKVLLFYLPCFLCAIFGDFEKGSSIALENAGRFEKAAAGIFMNFHETFCRGVNLLGMAKKTKERKYTKAGIKILRTVRTWAKRDNPNVLHYVQLFEAELSVLKGKLDAAEVSYQKALSLARRSGFLPDAAIIHERYASFFLVDRKSPSDARHHLMEGCKLYEEWGCRLKADQLRRNGEAIHLELPPRRVSIKTLK